MENKVEIRCAGGPHNGILLLLILLVIIIDIKPVYCFVFVTSSLTITPPALMHVVHGMSSPYTQHPLYSAHIDACMNIVVIGSDR